MLLLVKCYDNKKVYVILQLGHLSVDSDLGGEPTTTKKYISLNLMPLFFSEIPRNLLTEVMKPVANRVFLDLYTGLKFRSW